MKFDISLDLVEISEKDSDGYQVKTDYNSICIPNNGIIKKDKASFIINWNFNNTTFNEVVIGGYTRQDHQPELNY